LPCISPKRRNSPFRLNNNPDINSDIKIWRANSRFRRASPPLDAITRRFKCRDENFLREPSLQDALAYEVIYGRPVCELFAGVYQQAEQAVAARAKILNFRKLRKSDVRKQETIIQLATKASVNSAMQ
jgi:hypothetical protein